MSENSQLNLPRKTLAIFSLTSCEGCQFELLSFFDHFSQIRNFYDIKNFRIGQEENFPGPFDVALVEGSPDGEKHADVLRKIRKESEIVIALGACAHLGGIQSERNRLPKTLINKQAIGPIENIIKVDYTIPGCPVSHREAVACLMDLYWGKVFSLPDLGVCYECRINENECLIKNDKPCLGPITRAGCDSICVNKGEACLGCRGPINQANFTKMRQILATMFEEEEIANWLTIYGDYEKEWKKHENN